jgi:hypothetical protein
MKYLGFLLLWLLTGFTLFAQNESAMLKGRVTDENNIPLEFVSVSVKGETQGTKTNNAGEFVLMVSANRTVQIVFYVCWFRIENHQ